MPQTRLEPSSVCFIRKLEGVAEGKANRAEPGPGSYYWCDLGASHLRQGSPHTGLRGTVGESQNHPGMWACFGGKSGLSSQRESILLCNLGLVT